MIRVAIVADSHADETRRFDEHRRVMNWIAKDIRSRGCDLVAHAGDVWERRSTSMERAVVGDWFREVTEGADVVVIRGNHDDELDVEWLAKLRTKHPVHAFTRPGVLEVAGVVVGALPWPRKAQLVAQLGADVKPEDVARTARECLRNIIGGLADAMAALPARPRLFLTHAMICGAKTDHDQPIVGADMEVDASDLALARAHFTAVGHVHAQSHYDWDGHAIANIGSPIRQNFGEPGPKGYVIVEFADDGSSVRWERIATPTTPMLLVEAEHLGHEGGGMRNLTGGVFVEGAEMRLRYSCRSDFRAPAKSAAEQMRDAWLAAGAVSVKLEEEVVPITRARAPEVAAAETTEDQLVAYWKARGIEIAPERQARLLEKVATVVGSRVQGAKTRGAFRYTGIRHHGFATMQPVDIDLDATPGPLVAIVGPNGVGKSTTLELLYAAVHGDMPTRGSLGTLATSRTAQLEVGVCDQDGARFKIRHDVDCQTRKGTVLVTDAEGRAVLPDTQVSKFYKWVEDRTPPASVVGASMFAAQGSRGLLGMRDTELKKVILRAIGCEELEGWAEACRANAREATTRMRVAAERLADEARRALPHATAVVRLNGAEEAVFRAGGIVARAVQHVESVRAQADASKEAARLHAEGVEKFRVCSVAVEQAKAKLASLEGRMRADRELLGKAEEIDAAVVAAERLSSEHTKALAAVSDAREACQVTLAEVRRASDAYEAERRRYAEAQQRLRDASSKLAGLPAAEEAGAEVLRLEVAVADAEREEARLRAELEQLQGVALVGAEGRIGALRGALDGIAHDTCNASADALGALRQDDAAAVAAVEVPQKVGEIKAAILHTVLRVKNPRRDSLTAAQQTAAKLPALRALAAELETLRADCDAIAKTGREAKLALDTANAEAARGRERHQAALDVAAKLLSSWDRHRPLADRGGELAAARARIEALEPELRAAAGGVKDTEAGLAAAVLPAAPVPFDPDAVAAATRAHAHAVEGEQEARAALGLARQDVATAEASQARQDELGAERARHEEDVADWTQLADSLGKDGVQALLVDAAGPRLTTLANDLLHTCHGPRFTVRIDAAPFTADGKRQTEGCEIQVTDTKPRDDGTVGGEREGSTFSGGERGILNEALGLAMTMLVCQRSALRDPTLVRDETGAALDPENGQAYVAMLRRAAEQVGAHRVLFVSHDPALAALADGRIDLGAASTQPARPVVMDEAPKRKRTRKAAA